MNSAVQIHFFGSLQNLRPTSETTLKKTLDTSVPLTTLLVAESIPVDQIQIVMVNHRAVHKDVLIHPGDRVALFPNEYAIFADWKDFKDRHEG